MRPPHHTLDCHLVHRLAAEHLQAHLVFQDYKRKTSAHVLWSVLLAAAARITSVSDACRPFRSGPRKDACPYQALGPDLPTFAFWEPLQADREKLAQELSTSRSAGGDTPVRSC